MRRIRQQLLLGRQDLLDAPRERVIARLERPTARDQPPRRNHCRHAANERSRAALAQFAVFEGVFRKHMLVRGGQRRDSAWYSVIDDDWPAVKAVLRSRLERDASSPKP